jgi:6,7-dimethyl-8-ribityllumazine synthase
MIIIVKSEFNSKVTDGLLKGCLEALNENGYQKKDILIRNVPGAFEIPATIKKVIHNSNPKIVIALGCVIKGETDHYHFICDAVSNGVMSLTITTDIPILFGVLTCQTAELAYARSSKNKKKNKGYELGSAVKMTLENNYNLLN